MLRNISRFVTVGTPPAIALFLGVVLARSCAPAPAPTHSVTFVPETVLVRGEPDTVVKWRERIVTVVQPAIVREVAPDAGIVDVTRFCAETDAAIARADTTAPALPPVLLLRSAEVDPGYFLRKDRLTFIGPVSNGDLARSEYMARQGWSARVNGDSVIVRSPRFGLLKEIGEAGVWAGIGYLIGRF